MASGIATLASGGRPSVREDLGPDRSWVIYPGTDRYLLADGIEAIGILVAVQESGATGRAYRPSRPVTGTKRTGSTPRPRTAPVAPFS